jgi:ParB-like nuclease domain
MGTIAVLQLREAPMLKAKSEVDASEDEFDPIPKFDEARKLRAEIIAELEQGNDGERRLAGLLAKCRNGDRCHLVECPVCQRRERIALQRVPASTIKRLGSLFDVRHLDVDEITVIAKKRRPLDLGKVCAIAASINLIGLQAPITVRLKGKKSTLVSGWHRLAAVKRLGWDSIPCVVLTGDKIECRLWQLVENFYRVELTVLERAEHTAKLRLLVWQRGGQDAPPGGLQPKEKGINKTAKALGLTKEEVRRSIAIAAIPPNVKERLREVHIDNNQKRLLEIASQPTVKLQLQFVRKHGQRRCAAAAPAAGKLKVAAEISSLAEELKKLDERRAVRYSRLQQLQNNLVDAEDNLSRSTSAGRADDANPSDRAAVDPKFERLKTRWKKFMEADWERAPERSRTRFLSEVLGCPERVKSKGGDTSEARRRRRW